MGNAQNRAVSPPTDPRVVALRAKHAGEIKSEAKARTTRAFQSIGGPRPSLSGWAKLLIAVTIIVGGGFAALYVIVQRT
jgi:hypothetical protein